MPRGRPKKEESEVNEVTREAPKKVSTVVIPPRKPYFKLAPGKSITCKKGLLENEAKIEASYLAGGEEALQKLVDAGVLLEKF